MGKRAAGAGSGDIELAGVGEGRRAEDDGCVLPGSQGEGAARIGGDARGNACESDRDRSGKVGSRSNGDGDWGAGGAIDNANGGAGKRNCKIRLRRRGLAPPPPPPSPPPPSPPGEEKEKSVSH